MVTKLSERKPCHVSLCRPFQRLSVTFAYETVRGAGKKKNKKNEKNEILYLH